ncbi:hypothetical protein A3I34_00775 [Candidatus Jorgensenbacteria bacterium RIFCSPLOWO2_02_FULL_45_12]|uniref:Uncharacterized protein n=2 Tax=Candidatus Joergenseniibacteriota TaxID=1752739 RepID=A0A1F6BPP3_9BACT|nr:MAG: hypothetical protein UX22_C0002G0019 [Candidatus Jorgensenbacteria bacterium GW2011_GWA2_45_9]OGG38838.1 MAG: hypothetical protein A3D55_02495 [Candidatus Jorgensenbacteria bacterium RIFCSPHIGHO2_02_FULL_45_20]OGG42224.1 MAG: hypothetical protein A3I34_00775 [Candidatus Jorgensenbacteria bacterium RIFCSPLOWO2_02_FULL_45_12]
MISPTRVFNPFDGVEVRLFGRPTDWNIRGLESNRPPGRFVMGSYYDPISSVAFDAGVSRVLAPSPKSNTHIVGDEALGVEYHAESPSHPWRSVVICRGVSADGVEIPGGNHAAFWLSSADCLCVVALSPSGRLIGVHAGRDSLWDRAHVLNVAPRRKHASVIDTMASRLGDEMSRSQFFLTCGIGAQNFSHPWDHPQHGADNSKMTALFMRECGSGSVLGNPERGRLDLRNIATMQLLLHGVRQSNIGWDGINTFSDRDNGQPTWWSARRGDGTHRNGVLVYRV